MKGNILVVDDDPSVRSLFYDSLSDEGYTVFVSEDGPSALDILQRETINVIFLDLRLFGMDGIELCRQIRRSNPLSIIYAMTGWAALFEIEECREAGFDDYFIKPMSLDLMFKAVSEAFEKLSRWSARSGKIV